MTLESSGNKESATGTDPTLAAPPDVELTDTPTVKQHLPVSVRIRIMIMVILSNDLLLGSANIIFYSLGSSSLKNIAETIFMEFNFMRLQNKCDCAKKLCEIPAEENLILRNQSMS